MLEEPHEAPLFCPPLERFRLPSAALMAKSSVFSSHSFKEHMARQGNRPPGMCSDCHVHVCHGQTTALCTPFPMLPMSFCLAINFWHVAAYAHAIPPLPSAQKCSEDTETSGQEPQPRNGTRACTQVLKLLLWECSRAKICLAQGGVALPPTTF